MTFPSHLRTGAAMLALLTLLTGGLYPALTSALLQAGFPAAANGSLVFDDRGAVIGSHLIGQDFTDPKYLWGRLSATASNPYDAAASSGSNFGVTNPSLIDAAKARIAALKATDPGNAAPIPVDLVTASASGLDPEISPAAAAYQVRRIAKARGLGENVVRAAIAGATSGRTFGLLGEPRVNVLWVNQALDSIGR